MAASSETSTQIDKPRTKATVKLTPAEALQIIQQAAANCQVVGISVRLTPIYDRGARMVAIVLDEVELVDGMLVTASTGKETE